VSLGKKKMFMVKSKPNTNLYNKILIPSLNVGKMVGKLYQNILASKSYYTIL